MDGELGRVHLQPFSNRQYSRALRVPLVLNGELREVVPLWAHVHRAVSARCDLTPGPRPAVICTDAAGFGHLGVAVYVEGDKSCLVRMPPGGWSMLFVEFTN